MRIYKQTIRKQLVLSRIHISLNVCIIWVVFVQIAHKTLLDLSKPQPSHSNNLMAANTQSANKVPKKPLPLQDFKSVKLQ